VKKVVSKGLIALTFLPALFLPEVSLAAPSTIPAFVVDVNNPSSFSFSGSSVNSAITESANNISGTASGLTFENSGATNSLVFGVGRYLNFSNNVKPDVTNGTSIQIVALFTSSSYDGTWPRVLAFGSTAGWGSGNDEFSIQLSSTGQFQVYMNKSGTTGTYTCGTTGNAIVANAFAIYSVQVGPSGVCNVYVNGSTQATTTSEATVSFASRVPSTSNTWNFRVGSMSNNVQSTLPNGKIRSVILSAGTTSANSVTFMENGGSGYMASQIGSSTTSLSTNTFTRSGYTFTGWNTKADGTGTPYANGASFNFATSSAMLFAQWGVVPPSLSIPQLSAAIYRTTFPIAMTINSAGRYTFLDTGKRIGGCINLNGNPPTVTCNWRPTKIGAYSISAIGNINGTNYNSNAVPVIVSARSSKR
jgi:hypothetical protein